MVAHRSPGQPDYSVSVYGTEQTVVSGIMALDGLFMAATRRAVQLVRFDEANFDGFHLYDIDFTYSAYLSGLDVAVCNDILVLHFSHGSFGEDRQSYYSNFMRKYDGRLNEIPEKVNRFIPVHFDERHQVIAFHAKMLELASKKDGTT